MRSRILWCSMFVSMTMLFGFGCRKPVQLSSAWRTNAADTSVTSSAALPIIPAMQKPRMRKKEDTERAVSPEILFLRQAWRNLLAAHSFRATLTMPGTEGGVPISGEIAYVKTRGFHGTLRLQPALSTEILFLGDQVYFRTNTSTWQNVSYTPEADRIVAFFRVAFPLASDPKQPLISDSALIVETKEHASGCKQYTFSEYGLGETKDVTSLCIKNNIPLIATSYYAEGTVEIRYHDLNAPLTLPDPQ